MAKETTGAKEASDFNKNDAKKKMTLEVDLPEKEDLIVCEVCGHKNSKDVGMCTMCSNYLFD